MESSDGSALSAAFAKLAGIRRAADSLVNSPGLSGYFPPSQVGQYFKRFATCLAILQRELPDLFGDFTCLATEPGVEPVKGFPSYAREQLKQLGRDIEEIFEIRANSELQPPASASERPRRVFISHGRSKDWLEVQAYIERDVSIPTLELAQEPNLGMTVIEKLEANAPQCDSAVIVMTGDDIDADGRARARENVMHEIGFFQGRYGRKRVCVLHEEGVSIPTNLGGVVYVPFTKGNISAAFYVLARELGALYGRR